MEIKSEPVIVDRTFNVPARKVWEALTGKDQMKHWYFDIKEFKPEVGFEFQFEAMGKDNKPFLHLCKITEVIFCKKLTYSWRYDGYEGISFVTFELFAGGDSTRVRLTHAGLETFPNNSDFGKQNFVEGWTFIIGKSLKEFLEKNS